MGKEVLIPFVISPSLTVYIKCRYIPTIIDYGRCHIQYPAPAAEKSGAPTEHFGYYSSFAQKWGMFVNRSRPYNDLYKLIGFSMYGLMQSNMPTFDIVWPVMGFFGLKTKAEVLSWVQTNRNSNLFSLATEAEQQGFSLAKQMENGMVCLPEAAATMNDFLLGVVQPDAQGVGDWTAGA